MRIRHGQGLDKIGSRGLAVAQATISGITTLGQKRAWQQAWQLQLCSILQCLVLNSHGHALPMRAPPRPGTGPALPGRGPPMRHRRVDQLHHSLQGRWAMADCFRRPTALTAAQYCSMRP